MNNTNNNTDKNKTLTLEKDKYLETNQAELNDILTHDIYPWLKTKGKETVLFNQQTVGNMTNSINLGLRQQGVTENRVLTLLEKTVIWQNQTWAQRNKESEIWGNVIKDTWVTDLLKEKASKPLPFLNFLNYSKSIQDNKKTIVSEVNSIQENNKTLVSEILTATDTISLVQNKPLGIAGDITINELISKGIDIIDTPLVQMIKENVNVQVTGSFLTSLILYRTIVNLYMKSAYREAPLLHLPGPSTRSKEIALFMIMGAPIITGALIGIKVLIAGGTKVIVSIAESNNLEGTGTSSTSSSSSFFLILNKLPNWVKIILRYIALFLIITFITSIIGYKSTIIVDIYSQFYIYLGYFLKLYSILNSLVILYYTWKLYIIIMFSNNKDFINPDAYPKWIKNELLESKEIAVKVFSVNPGWVYKHYLKLIFLYISIVLFGLSAMILNSIYVIP